MRANGEDRAIRQPDGLSDMQELVTQGGNVVMILVTARNRLGERCRVIDWVQILSGELKMPSPGGRPRRATVSRKIDTNIPRPRVERIPQRCSGRGTSWFT